MKQPTKKHHDLNLDRLFHALSDSTRRALIARLCNAPGCVTDLAAPFDISLNAVSKHLKTLEAAGLITRQNVGRSSICSLRPEALHGASAWIERNKAFWSGSLDSLEKHMEGQAAASRSGKRHT